MARRHSCIVDEGGASHEKGRITGASPLLQPTHHVNTFW
jgi:hypothetical protein